MGDIDSLHTMDVNGVHQLFGLPYFSQKNILFSAEEINSYWLGTT